MYINKICISCPTLSIELILLTSFTIYLILLLSLKSNLQYPLPAVAVQLGFFFCFYFFKSSYTSVYFMILLTNANPLLGFRHCQIHTICNIIPTTIGSISARGDTCPSGKWCHSKHCLLIRCLMAKCEISSKSTLYFFHTSPIIVFNSPFCSPFTFCFALFLAEA